MSNPKTVIRGAILALAVIAVGTFVFYNTRDLVFGQPLVVSSPHDGATVRSAAQPVTGHISNASSITLNGAQILTDDRGLFSKVVLLSPGLNVIEVAAEDRFNRETKKVLRVLYVPERGS